MKDPSDGKLRGPKGLRLIEENFGSGWVWVVLKDSKIDIVTISNADFPDIDSIVLVADVWEHAYYVDYRNKRDEFLKIFINHLVNLDLLEEKL